MSELKIEGDQSLVLSFTYTYELEQQRYLFAPHWHMGAHLSQRVCCRGHRPALHSPTGAWGPLIFRT